ncbi:UvrABC system protein C [Bienertia sinuspersici]
MQIGRCKNLVKEGCCRIISHFRVCNNTGKHRATNHAYKINFFKRVVKDCEDG